MSNSNNTKSNFWQLIQDYTIEIPIIQRDYAQGRLKDKQTKKIRARFLENLISALETNQPQELDFIYGIIEKDNVLQPLDGQQRLTTLFLLHWFVSFRSGKCTGEVQKTLSKFTYETRVSSREFCKQLIKKGNALGSEEKIVELIKDSAWFFQSWQKDPTIKAMLVMLENIEDKLQNKDLLAIWQRLTSDNPPLTFNFVSLEDIGHSDDIYVKMNARGKQLTNFEHFKARFEKYIVDRNNWGNASDEAREHFAHKIDTKWTDLFWKYKNDNNQIDDTFIRFIAAIVMSRHAQRTKEDVKSRASRIQELFNEPDSIEPEDFNEDDFIHLTKCLDMYSENNNDKKMPTIKLWELGDDISKDNSSLFQLFMASVEETSYAQHALFYAHTVYLLECKDGADFKSSEYSNWMRVARNIILNNRVDESRLFISAIGLITELSNESNAIYRHLAKNQPTERVFAEQIKEERLKAKIITASSKNKTAIFNAEDVNFCKGRIAFALYCVGIDMSAIDINNSTDIVTAFDHKKLEAIQKPIKEYLNNDDISSKFRRALLTMGEHDFYEYDHKGWSWSTESQTWFLIQDTEDLKESFAKKGKYKDYLKELLNLLITKRIDVLIKDFVKRGKSRQISNWKWRLIKEPNLLEDPFQYPYRFGIKKDNNGREYCLLFLWGGKRPRSEEYYCKKVR